MLNIFVYRKKNLSLKNVRRLSFRVVADYADNASALRCVAYMDTVISVAIDYADTVSSYVIADFADTVSAVHRLHRHRIVRRT